MCSRSKPLIYIAGPYTSPDPVENTHNACRLGVELIDDGYVTPVVPHATLVMQMVVPRQDVNYWYKYDLEVMARCDAVFRMPGKSTGADAEIAAAIEQGLPVWYSKEALYEWADQWRNCTW